MKRGTWSKSPSETSSRLDDSLQSSGPDTLGIVAPTHSLQPDVRVNCVSPGWIDTGMHAIESGDHEQHPVGRVGRPEDIAAAVAFLLDAEQSGFMTGQEILVDGGMTRKMIYV